MIDFERLEGDSFGYQLFALKRETDARFVQSITDAAFEKSHRDDLIRELECCHEFERKAIFDKLRVSFIGRCDDTPKLTKNGDATKQRALPKKTKELLAAFRGKYTADSGE